MPHKKNPIVCERICGMARLLRANSMVAFENVALWHERDISHSSAERIILPDSTILLDYMLDKMNFVISNLDVYPENMKKNLGLTQGLIYSQKLLSLLVEKGLSRNESYEIIQRLALKSYDEKKNFTELVRKDLILRDILESYEIEECFKLENHLKQVDFIFNKVGI
jgi:adenylosuccinate lyase